MAGSESAPQPDSEKEREPAGQSGGPRAAEGRPPGGRAEAPGLRRPVGVQLPPGRGGRGWLRAAASPEAGAGRPAQPSEQHAASPGGKPGESQQLPVVPAEAAAGVPLPSTAALQGLLDPTAAAQEANTLLKSGQPGQALGYCSLAVLAGSSNARHLRLRAACLAELQEFDRALEDLDHVLRVDGGDRDLPTRVEDLCSRGRLLLSLGDEARATGAFAQALKLAPTLAQSSLWERPGRGPTAQAFLCHSQTCLEEQRYAEAWTAAENGLLADPEHSGLKRLKARLRRQASLGCRLH